MSYTLVITEKPTAAEKIASALSEGSVKRSKNKGVDYYKITRGGRDIVVAPAVGHLFILSEGEKKKKWTYPVFTVEWKPTFSNKNNLWAKKYFQNMHDLIKKAGDLISACDYDVEGSVIAYNIIRFMGKTENGKRMKFSTLTGSDIEEAYDNASPRLDFPQIEAGLARHQLDWIFGINLSRALTLSLEHIGGFWTLSTGRVQGPVLEILEKRQKEIEAFKPKPFWQIEIQVLHSGNEFTALHVKDKFWEEQEAQEILEKCKGKPGTVESLEKREQKQYPPFPFDLTTLQRESYGLFGYSPKQTLDIAQSLYEHALISYPRTSSQKLPAKLGHKAIITRLSKQGEYSELCKKLLSRKFLKPNEGKKEDPAHPAIFPTGMKPKKLNPYQKKVYDLIVRRFLSVFADPAVREMIKAVIGIEGEDFIAHGIRTLVPNWIEFYKPYARFKDNILPGMNKGDSVDVRKIDLLDKETQPPPRYTQASILYEMEKNGIGTKATRSQILQTLYDRGYIQEKSIVVTRLGQAVVQALEKYSPEIVSVELTRKFEREMEDIENGKKRREDIIKEAEEELTRILKDFKEHEKEIGRDILEAVKEYERSLRTVGKCEKCGKDLMIIHSKKTGKRFVGCTGYPKCSNSYPLPQHGYLTVTPKPCKTCALHLIQVKSKGRRPWRFCIKCGFEVKRKTKGKGRGKAKTKK